MAVKIEVKTNANAKVLKGLKHIAKIPPQHVKVGFVEDVKERRKKSTLTNAFLGYVHEHGSPAKGIPARAFLFPAFMTEARQAEARIRQGLAREWIEPGSTEKGLGEAGTLIRDRAKLNIVDCVNIKPLSKGTLYARQRIGFDGTKPLLHTAQLLNAITYVVK